MAPPFDSHPDMLSRASQWGKSSTFFASFCERTILLVNEFSRLDKKFSSHVPAKNLCWTSVLAHNIPTGKLTAGITGQRPSKTIHCLTKQTSWTLQEPTLIRRYSNPARPASPTAVGQWGGALKASAHSPKGDVSYVGALEPTARSGAHGFRSRRPRSLLTVLNYCRISISSVSVGNALT